MRTIGIGPGDAVLVIEHRGEQQIVYNALVAGITMKRELTGEHGEPAIAASFIAQRDRAMTTHGHLTRLDELPEVWLECPTLTIRGVVHISHRDWIERRASLGYEELPARPERSEAGEAGEEQP